MTDVEAGEPSRRREHVGRLIQLGVGLSLALVGTLLVYGVFWAYGSPAEAWEVATPVSAGTGAFLGTFYVGGRVRENYVAGRGVLS